MQYKFQGDYIVATAETLQENAVLLSTQGALQLNVVKTPPHKEPKQKRAPRWDKGMSQNSKKEILPLKEKLDSMPRNSSAFISDDIAKFSKDLGAYAYYRITKKRGIPVSVHETEGGYNVTIK